MNWKGFERRRLWPNLHNIPDICLEGGRKTETNFIQNSRRLDENVN
jgi:hypothetical protein